MLHGLAAAKISRSGKGVAQGYDLSEILRTFYCPHFVCNWLQSIISSFEVNQIKRYWLFVKLPMVRGVIWHKIYSNSKSWVLLLKPFADKVRTFSLFEDKNFEMTILLIEISV